MFCSKCGKEICDEAVVCVHCGCSTQNNLPAAANTNDAPSTGMAILGFFFPLVGFIYWIVCKDTKPLSAKSAGKGALIGIIVSTVFSVIFTVIYGVLMGSLIGSMMLI